MMVTKCEDLFLCVECRVSCVEPYNMQISLNLSGCLTQIIFVVKSFAIFFLFLNHTKLYEHNTTQYTLGPLYYHLN